MSSVIHDMDEALEAIAPGTPLRSAINMILAADSGALICLGDEESILKMGMGGFAINTSFAPYRLFELAKMDGAIVCDAQAHRIYRANFHLMPMSSFETKETGMRHSTAMSISLQTDALVIAVSQRRSTVTLYLGGESFVLNQRQPRPQTTNEVFLAMKNARDVLNKEMARLSCFEKISNDGDGHPVQ